MLEFRHVVAGDPVTVYVPENEADLRRFMEWARTRPVLALDTEGTGLNIYGADFRLRTVQFGDAHEAWVIHWERGGRFHDAALYVLRNAAHLLIHNAPFDWLVLDKHTPLTLEELAPRTTDTSIKLTLVDPREPKDGGIGRKLKQACAHYVDPAAPDTQGDLTAVFNALGCTKQTGWALIDLFHPTYNLYAGLDVILTARLNTKLTAEHERLSIRRALMPYEHELARISAVMRRTGLLLDLEYAQALRTRLDSEERHWSGVAARYGVSSVNSGAQVAEALTAMGERLTLRTDSGALKVDKAVLLPLADLDRDWNRVEAREPNPLADAVLRSKRAGKWRSTYAERFLTAADADGRIHPSINTLQARTGRMSISGDLAAQQLPSSDWVIRRAVLAEEGHVMLSTDFTAVELRVLAALADVKQMKQAIAAGADLHDFTARIIYGEGFTPRNRKVAKGIGLGKVYGGGLDTLVRQTGAPRPEVSKALGIYDRAYPEIKRTSARWQREARNTGLVTITPTGRRVPLDRDRMYAIVNYQCQSVARDLLGQALINCEAAGLLPYMRLPVHDEIVASVPKAEAQDFAREFQRCMTMQLGGVPIDADPEIGKRSWGSLYGSAE